MDQITVFVDEMAVTLPEGNRVEQAVRAYLSQRDPDLLRLADRQELYAVGPCGQLMEESAFLEPLMRMYIRKKGS